MTITSPTSDSTAFSLFSWVSEPRLTRRSCHSPSRVLRLLQLSFKRLPTKSLIECVPFFGRIFHTCPFLFKPLLSHMFDWSMLEFLTCVPSLPRDHSCKPSIVLLSFFHGDVLLFSKSVFSRLGRSSASAQAAAFMKAAREEEARPHG